MPINYDEIIEDIEGQIRRLAQTPVFWCLRSPEGTFPKFDSTQPVHTED